MEDDDGGGLYFRDTVTEFVEEEYAPQDLDFVDEGITDPSHWWGSVNDLCSQAYQDDDGGGYVEEDDLVSLVSDDEDGAVLKKKYMEIDPNSSLKISGLNWEWNSLLLST